VKLANPVQIVVGIKLKNAIPRKYSEKSQETAACGREF
jgi:hypothetical protein